ncbi:Gfo/Idh/MocA family oxidoreductase [Massilia sp. BJB1822]|nr:Gfo/Idh/MocA family oxidoreductase [Massilia sp. BJB1822]
MPNRAPKQRLRVVVVGLGQMGRSHALAYHNNPAFEIVALCSRGTVDLPPELKSYRMVDSLAAGLDLRPDVVSINTYTDSHVELAIQAMKAGAHVFVEKPLALTSESARAAVDTARRTGRKLVVGYILRHHPSWNEFIKTARGLGAPYVMRMNLNQPSVGPAWEIHKRLLETTPPFVDCGVHYVDVMCQVTDARPVQVRGMGVRLAGDIAPDQVNYSHLQILFEDGSVGWYEAGWGPMISGTASMIKNVIGTRGAVSLVMGEGADSADINSHTSAGQLCLRIAPTAAHSQDYSDGWISIGDGVGHQSLCDREQAFLAEAILDDLDLGEHHAAALRSLDIVLAAERSMRENRAIDL